MPSDSILAAYATPTTELQAVNVILEAIGQTPVSSLETASLNVSAEKAIKRLGEALIETLEEGWHCNTLAAFILDPNTDGTISVPPGTLKATMAYFHNCWKFDLIVDGDKLFDRKTNSFQIGQTVAMNLVRMKEFETLPQALRWYITVKAARRAVAGGLVSTTAYQFAASDEQQARLRWEQADSQTADRNLGRSPFMRKMRRR